MKNFNTQEEAKNWMINQLEEWGEDIGCIDNFRLAFVESQEEMEVYDGIKDKGCCGFFDETVMINNKRAMIGCNYGH